MRKATFCICENKGADQLPGNHAADQRPYFRSIGSAIFLLPKSKISILIFCGCTARFVSDLMQNPEGRFSHDEAHFIMQSYLCIMQQFFEAVKMIIFS